MIKIFVIIVSACVVLSGAVAPLTPEELQHIREFTAKAHMKRIEAFPDQIMTASTTHSHYLGRRLPAPEKPPTIFMQAPSNNINAVVKPTAYAVQPQAAPSVQNLLINYPLAPNNGPPGGPIFQQRQPPQQQQILQFLPAQHAPPQQQQQQGQIPSGGQLRGPQPQPAPQQFNKRPSFFNFPDASSHTSIFSFFFPRRPARRPQFRPPLRFQFAAAPSNSLQQHEQGLQSVMTQQHLLTVQQQQGQQSTIQPSASPLAAQSTTIKNALGMQTGPSPAAPQILPTATLVPFPARFIPHNNIPFINHQQPQQQGNPNQGGGAGGPPQQPPPHPNQFHREITFFGKPIGKPRPPLKFGPFSAAFIPQNRPGDANNFVQKFVGPQPDFNFLPFGPPPVIAGPTGPRFGNLPPVSFSHIEQIPMAGQPPRVLPMPMVIQSQEFPHYQFRTTFASGGSPAIGAIITPTVITKPAANQAASTSQDAQAGGTNRPQKVRRVKPRVNGVVPSSTTGAPVVSSTPTLGEIIFESSKETREFHDSARLVASPSVSFVSNNDAAKPRKPKQSNQELGSLQKASGVENSVVLAPLVFSKQSSEPIVISSSSPRPPVSSTVMSVSTVSVTTEEPYKSKIVKSKGVEFHKTHKVNNHHNHNHNGHSDKKVTASGSGLVVTAEPMRVSSTGSASTSSRFTASPGRVVTTSVTSRVVSTGVQNPQKRYRLRKVKVPNPDAKANKATSPSMSSTRTTTTTTTIIPSTTSVVSSSSQPRSTTTVLSTSTTEGSSSSSSSTTVA